MKNINIISFTKQGQSLALKLKELYSNAFLYGKEENEQVKRIDKDIKSFTGDIFYESDLIIFISALGIAVRSIAPYIISKDKDAAVIVFLHSEAVITTSTDRNNKFAVDNFAVNNNLYIKDITKIKEVSSRILNGENVGFISDYKVSGKLPEGLVEDMHQECGIVISKDMNNLPFTITMQLIPKEYVLGIGARKGADYNNLYEFVESSLKKYNILREEILAVVSIDIKKDEEAIFELAKEYNVPFITYSSEVLQNVKGDFNKSDFVKKVTGVDNVCERAVKAYDENIEMVMKKTAYNGVTLAIGKLAWQGNF